MRISLTAQIAEVEYELGQRATVYPRIAQKSPNRRSELELHVERMQAVEATLQWLRENETDVRAYVKAKKVKKAEGEAA